MAWLRSLLFNLSFYISTLVLAVLSVPASLIFGARAVQFLFARWCRWTLFLVRYVLGAVVEIRGRENLPANGVPALLVSKHQSELDVALMGVLFPNYGAIAMRELDNYPLVGGIISKLGHIKVTVKGMRDNQLPEVLEGSRRVHQEGRPILIYPEATLMKIGTKQRYRSGVWHIYKELDVPATPVAVSLGLIWPQRQWRKFPAKAAIEFLPPIAPGLSRADFLTRLENDIETASNAMIHELATPEVLSQITFDHEDKKIEGASS